MIYRHVGSALLTTLFLLIGQSLALAAECAVCDRNFADCRSPLQARYVSCMNASSTTCGSKCSEDCKNNKEVQKCTFSCIKTCQGGSSSCQGTLRTASTQCTNAYQSCKKGCTVSVTR